MARARILLSSLVVLLAWASISPAAAGSTSGKHWEWPLSPRPEVVAPFAPPAERWGSGHRGVDLAGSVGQPVLAIGAGTVSFAGVVAGRGVVVVDHGVLRSTYQPVLADVHRGDTVTAGQLLGTLELLGSHCLPDACLHLGIRRGEDYVDPLSLFGPTGVRLKPLIPDAPPAAAADALSHAQPTANPLHSLAAKVAPTGSRDSTHHSTANLADPAALVAGAGAGLLGTLALRRRLKPGLR